MFESRQKLVPGRAAVQDGESINLETGQPLDDGAQTDKYCFCVKELRLVKEWYKKGAWCLMR